MRNGTLVAVAALVMAAPSYAQIEISRAPGGPAVTNLGMGIAVNKGSTLQREWLTVNIAEAPAKLEAVGIKTTYVGREYAFEQAGRLTVAEPLAAVELRFMLFDVWGEHLKTLSNTEIRDLRPNVPLELSTTGTWRAWETEVSEYLTAVGFIARTRTIDGRVWAADLAAVRRQVEAGRLAVTEEALAPKAEPPGP